MPHELPDRLRTAPQLAAVVALGFCALAACGPAVPSWLTGFFHRDETSVDNASNLQLQSGGLVLTSATTCDSFFEGRAEWSVQDGGVVIDAVLFVPNPDGGAGVVANGHAFGALFGAGPGPVEAWLPGAGCPSCVDGGAGTVIPCAEPPFWQRGR